VRHRVFAASIVVVLVLAACGGSSDEDQVRGTVDDLYGAFADKDPGQICDQLARDQREAVAKGGGAHGPATCEEVMGVALNCVGRGKGLEDADSATVTKVELDGDEATATVELQGRSSRLGLRKEGGEWKVSDLNLNRL